MVYKIKRIARDVRVAIDENVSDERLLAEDDVDTLTLEEIVRSKIVDAVRRVVVNAPTQLLDGGVPFGDAIFWREQFSGWLLLPDDFMRLVIFKMSDWERPVYEPITVYDPLYQVQYSRHKGIRGNPQKPVVALVSRAEGRALELFSCKSSSATIEQASYLPLPNVDSYGGIEIPERCYRAVVYETAGLVLATIGQAEQSAIMRELSKEILV